ncbi:MAG: hypothetical protein VZS44_01250 [Bacilli bacterium]|nr:hypothetical protein [Bacilli bacterium]
MNKDIIRKNMYLYLCSIVVLLIILTILTPTYAKFSHDYITDEDAVGITFDFSLNIEDIEEYKSISIDSYDAKIFNIKVTNNTMNTIYYGVWYRMVEPKEINDNIIVAKLEDSVDNTSGDVESNNSKVVSVIVKNKTNKKIKIDFGVASSDKDANSVEYLAGKKLIIGTDQIQYLNTVDTGDYVEYVGSNGCSGNSCRGENANYVNSENMGYCNNKNLKFRKVGWQIAYIDDNIAYLVSAAPLECLATEENGSLSLDNNKLSTFEKTIGTPKHIANLNIEALKYCNEEFAIDGECNTNTTWAFNTKDLNKINNMPTKACYKIHSEACEGFNEIIRNSGDFWLASSYDETNTTYYWDAINNYLVNVDTSYSLGLRVVIKLDPNIYIIDGDGSINKPYKISNEIIKEDK